jgi:hypothetical protein
MNPRPTSALPVLLLLLAACHDEDSSPTLENLWPSTDGSSWAYEYVGRTWSDEFIPVYSEPADIPPPPTLEEIAALFENHPIGPSPEIRESAYALRFEGTITTESGATGQHLVSERTGSVPALRSDAYPLAFLASLWIARPDLRDRLTALGLSPTFESRGDLGPEPVLLSGYAWARTDDWIGGFGDLDLGPSWIYLTADLKPGLEFTHQLVPALADDIFLHGRILPRQSVDTPAGVFDDVVVCLYLVDYGLGQSTDDSGGSLGYFHPLSYGKVAYARDVGPVASYERLLVSTGDPLPIGTGDLTLSLTNRTIAEN